MTSKIHLLCPRRTREPILDIDYTVCGKMITEKEFITSDLSKITCEICLNTNSFRWKKLAKKISEKRAENNGND